MKSALIGYTGFVGSNLQQSTFTHHYNSKNIESIKEESFDLVVCAGISAKKWWANLHPDEDLAAIQVLLDNLKTVRAERFILISTIDVYPTPKEVDEDTCVQGLTNHAYGTHRYMVEEFVRKRFTSSQIVRLPGLVGRGLKKNVIFDLLNNNCLEKINPRSSFQYYSLDNLTKDLQKVAEANIPLLNLSTEPISTEEIVRRYFKGAAVGADAGPEGRYDMRSIHASRWGGKNGYLYPRESVFKMLDDFIEREKSLPK